MPLWECSFQLYPASLCQFHGVLIYLRIAIKVVTQDFRWVTLMINLVFYMLVSDNISVCMWVVYNGRLPCNGWSHQKYLNTYIAKYTWQRFCVSICLEVVVGCCKVQVILAWLWLGKEHFTALSEAKWGIMRNVQLLVPNRLIRCSG